ncbi:integrase core domain containing protein [Nitzschia inconspicua]|uniref:Integrase core domain containing protein n=1 Tax=Nitzschia inconspicua TaxID=303405 RepID=A0A9K3LB96_9STRA|nr:integrase core domain containing protein [Nitzschia inconspicua]
MSRTSRRKVVRYQPYPEQSQTPAHHGEIRDESNIQCYPVFDNNPTPQGDAEERKLTEVEEREIQYNSFHEKYNQLMFNIDLDGNGLDGKPPIVPRCSQQLTNDSYEQLLEICFANQSGDEDRWRAVFHKYKTKIYDVIKNYHAKMLTNAEGEEVARLYFGNRIAVPQRDVFAVIRDCHVSRSRHTKQNATSAMVRKMYCNITQKMVNTFIQMCPTCIRRPPVIKPLKGAASPIMSAAFRNRFQVDLIDMQDQATEDIRGVLCNFIVVLKDHFTRLSYCEPIPRKQPIFVAEVLCRIFGLIGAPKLLHSDNGNEFTSQELIEAVKDLDKDILSVFGRPRKPNDQGSVEIRNKMVKSVLSDVQDEQRRKGKTTNWTTLMGHLMGCLNSHELRGANDTSAYETVFGVPYHENLLCHIDEMRRCTTLEQRVRINPDPRFEASLREEFYIDGDDPVVNVDTGIDDALMQDFPADVEDGDEDKQDEEQLRLATRRPARGRG